MAYFHCNKGKLIMLCREFGYDPPQNATFTKTILTGHWWLEWYDNGRFYRAVFSNMKGKTALTVNWRYYADHGTTRGDEACYSVALEQLRRLQLLQQDAKEG